MKHIAHTTRVERVVQYLTSAPTYWWLERPPFRPPRRHQHKGRQSNVAPVNIHVCAYRGDASYSIKVAWRRVATPFRADPELLRRVMPRGDACRLVVPRGDAWRRSPSTTTSIAASPSPSSRLERSSRSLRRGAKPLPDPMETPRRVSSSRRSRRCSKMWIGKYDRLRLDGRLDLDRFLFRFELLCPACNGRRLLRFTPA